MQGHIFVAFDTIENAKACVDAHRSGKTVLAISGAPCCLDYVEPRALPAKPETSDRDAVVRSDEPLRYLSGAHAKALAPWPCRSNKQTSISPPPLPPQMPGDWQCGACHTMNFARRSVCFTCKEPRVDETASMIAQGVPVLLSGMGSEKPSPRLRLFQLDPNITETEIAAFLSDFTPSVRDIRCGSRVAVRLVLRCHGPRGTCDASARLSGGPLRHETGTVRNPPL